MDVLFGLAGSLLLATGVGWLARNVLRLRAYSNRAEGTVTGFTEPDSDGNRKGAGISIGLSVSGA
jgi:hypothetical protein